MSFHTSTNYQIQAPPPYDKDVHEDIIADIARMRAQTYPSEFDFHLDLTGSLKRLRDGHAYWRHTCYVRARLPAVIAFADLTY